MKQLIKSIFTGCFLVAAILACLLVINPVTVDAATNSSYDKIIKYITDTGTKSGDDSAVMTVKLAKDTTLSYDSVNQCISVVYKVTGEYGDVYKKAIHVYVNSPVGEVKLDYESDVWGVYHLSDTSATESLYTGKDGKKYKYLSSQFHWDENMSPSANLDTLDSGLLENIEAEWLSFMNSSSTAIKKKVGVTFKPFTKLGGYESIPRAYKEPVNTYVSVKLPYKVEFGDLENLEYGDSVTYKASYDLNGDKKKEKITIKFTAKDEWNTEYAVLVKINSKTCYSMQKSFMEGYSWEFKIFDLNPGDKLKELELDYTEFWSTEVMLYRFAKDKVECMHDVGLRGDRIIKQKKDDNLQLEAEVWIFGGYVDISTSLAPVTRAVVGPKNRIYNTLKPETEYRFVQNMTLYKTSACTEKSGSSAINDYGTIQKVKLSKDGLQASHLYVVLSNGKKGWVKLSEYAGYLIYDENDYWL